jgi:Ca-activated chloride channel family protein
MRAFRSLSVFAAALGLILLASACQPGAAGTLRVVSGSENQALEPLFRQFEQESGVKVEMSYQGSVDIKLLLASGEGDYDAVWPANSLWLTLGDTGHRVSHVSSIFTSPVVFGIAMSKARSLGFVGRDVYVKDILAAIQADKLSFYMTSATQSNSGATAYLGFLYALAGNPDVLSAADLDKPALQEQARAILAGVNRGSASSAWLKDLFLKSPGADAMVNYESVLLDTNAELVKQGREPLYLVYPVDGLVVSDSPLGFLKPASGAADPAAEKNFLTFQAWLLRPEIQAKLLALGRRTGMGGGLEGADPAVFKPEWGVDPARVLSGIRLPGATVIDKALSLYQTLLRKPSLTVFCLDFSGSMADSGEAQLKEAMRLLLDQGEAAAYLLQAGKDDRILLLPFSSAIIDRLEASGNDPATLAALEQRLNAISADGKTDIYSPVMAGLDYIGNLSDRARYQPAIVLMTDGEHNNPAVGFVDYDRARQASGLDVPVFSIMFGDAKQSQLDELAVASRGRVFDGRTSLAAAFRTVKGYN